MLGFIKFLGPYYMLLITKRRQIGAICGHTVYAITKSEMIPLPNAATRSKIVNFRSENRFVFFMFGVSFSDMNVVYGGASL